MNNQRVLLLEAQLDKDPASARSQKEFMRILGTTYAHRNITVVARDVHTKEDLKFFLGWARKDPAYTLIHFVGHGSKSRRSTNLHLTRDTINLKYESGRKLFRGLDDRYLLFSCCDIGKDKNMLDTLRRSSGAAGVFAYAVAVYDYQSFLIDAMLYHLLFGNIPYAEEKRTPKFIKTALDAAIHELHLYQKGRGHGRNVLGASVC